MGEFGDQLGLLFSVQLKSLLLFVCGIALSPNRPAREDKSPL